LEVSAVHKACPAVDPGGDCSGLPTVRSVACGSRAALLAPTQLSARFDVQIRNAGVMDGSGNPGRTDVEVLADRIAFGCRVLAR
jgi:hypothetical protein